MVGNAETKLALTRVAVATGTGFRRSGPFIGRLRLDGIQFSGCLQQFSQLRARLRARNLLSVDFDPQVIEYLHTDLAAEGFPGDLLHRVLS